MKVHNYQYNRQVALSADGAPEIFIKQGWGQPEATGCWTVSRSAKLSFIAPNPTNKTYTLVAKCFGFTGNGHFDSQMVEVFINNINVAIWHVKAIGNYTVDFPSIFIHHGVIEVEFIISNPTSPRSLGMSIDGRDLGIHVVNIAINDADAAFVCEYGLGDFITSQISKIGKGADPIGDMFEAYPFFIRAIRSESASFVYEMMSQGYYAALERKQLIPKHLFRRVVHPQYTFVAITMSSQWRVWPGCYPVGAIIDACSVWLEANRTLLSMGGKREVGLIDGHLGNFQLFQNSRPTWVDLGSIAYVDEENDELWRFGVDEFMRCCLYPAVIATRHPHATGSVRNLLKKRQMGLSHDEAALALGAEDLHRVNSWRAFSGRKLDLVEELQSYVKELRFEVDETSWGDYRGEGILPQVVSGNFLKKNSDPRFARISKEAQATRAKTFIDAGANDGLFSLLLTNLGMNGIAFDIDEKSINKLYEFLRNQPSINLVASLEDFESAPYEADLVLGLALTHHLYFTVGLTFDAMAAKFAEMTKNVLITEFMPDGLGGTPVHPKPAPIPFPKEYNIEAFLAAFRNKFGSVEVVNYKRRGPSTRTLVVCKK